MTQAGYKYTTRYMLGTVIYDLTVEFCNKFFPGREHLRIREQMVHAGRSGVQNQAEGYAQTTSLKGYIKLMGVGKGSFEELRLDFEDYLRQHGLALWDKNDKRIRVFRDFRVKWISANTLNSPISLINTNSPEEFCNLMITLLSLCTFLLDKQLRALEEKFTKEGGYTENLFKRRLDER